jgi:catechol 2,3-dioxygenase-like lactoylglutathione lyase family enzyme
MDHNLSGLPLLRIAMPVNGINHLNIRTTDVAASSRFYVEVLDFKFREGAPVMGRQPNWLFDQSGRPIIHLRLMAPDSQSTGPIDHVALDCEGLSSVIERLKARDLEFNIASTQPGLTIVFVKDPHGVMLELNFRDEAAPSPAQPR